MHESEKWKWSGSVVSDSSDPMDCSPPGSSIHGIFQARVLEWGAIAFSKYSQESPYSQSDFSFFMFTSFYLKMLILKSCFWMSWFLPWVFWFWFLTKFKNTIKKTSQVYTILDKQGKACLSKHRKICFVFIQCLLNNLVTNC